MVGNTGKNDLVEFSPAGKAVVSRARHQRLWRTFRYRRIGHVGRDTHLLQFFNDDNDNTVDLPYR
jgi:hypothetical protein